MLRRFSILLSIIISSLIINADEKKLTIGVTDSPPFIIIDDGKISGVTIDLWNSISDSLNIDYDFVIAENDKVITNITEGKINISIAPMMVSSAFGSSTFFTQPFYISNICVAIEDHYESGFVTEYLFFFFLKNYRVAYVNKFYHRNIDLACREKRQSCFLEED